MGLLNNPKKSGNLKMKSYQNGNTTIQIDKDGTRIISFDDEMKLDYPLNIDIRLSNRCPLGYNPKVGKAVCSFCHESARTDGELGNIEQLKDLLDKAFPKNFHIELAVGVNEMLPEVKEFFEWATKRGFIINATVNQLTVSSNRKSTEYILDLIQNQNVRGLGLSFRNLETFEKTHPDIVQYENTVVHVIAGIDNIDEIKALKKHGVKKVLVLGEKEFGFNVDSFHSKEREMNRKIWLLRIQELFKEFDVVSFDNLALEQLKLKRFFSDEEWGKYYQGEHSFYINAVDGYYSPSSRSHFKMKFNEIGLKEFFHQIIENPSLAELKESETSKNKLIPILSVA